MNKNIRSCISGFSVILLVSLLCLIPNHVQAAVTNQSLAAPLYAPPTDKSAFWNDIRSAGASSIPFIIANPSNGPGTVVIPIYNTAIAKNDAANIKTIGYVQTNYQSRPYKETLNDIDTWYRLYPSTKGIMIDLVKEGSVPEVCYVAGLYTHIKNTRPNDLVILNAGGHISDAYEPYADIFVNASMDYGTYQSWTPQYRTFETRSEYQNRFWHIVYGVSPDQYSSAFQQVRSNNAGWVYITDQTAPSPFSATPSYWQNEASDVSALPASKIPNRGVTSLPRGCISLSASTDNTVDTTPAKQSSTSSTITINNISQIDSEPITTLQVMSMPRGVNLTNLSAEGWLCDLPGKICRYTKPIPLVASPPKIHAVLAANCDYGGGEAQIRLTNYTGNQWDAKIPVRAPFGCEPTSGAGKLNGDTSGQVISLTTQSIETTAEIKPLGGAVKNNDTEEKVVVQEGLSFLQIVGIVFIALMLMGLAAWAAWIIYKRKRYRVDI